MDNKLYDANRIYDAGTKAMTGSRFKYKTQLYEMTQLLQTAKLQDELMHGAYRPGPGQKFPINERGHSRYITSNIMGDKESTGGLRGGSASLLHDDRQQRGLGALH